MKRLYIFLVLSLFSLSCTEMPFDIKINNDKDSENTTDQPSSKPEDDPEDKPEDEPSGEPSVDDKPEVTPLTTPYFEYPQTLKPSDDYVYGTLRGTTYSSRKNVRNYSYCYDVRRHNPMWVAYPCHNIYWEGGYTRPNPDPWRPNPDLTEQQQSVIYASDWNNWPWSSSSNKPEDKYNYWTIAVH